MKDLTITEMPEESMFMPELLEFNFICDGINDFHYIIEEISSLKMKLSKNYDKLSGCYGYQRERLIDEREKIIEKIESLTNLKNKAPRNMRTFKHYCLKYNVEKEFEYKDEIFKLQKSRIRLLNYRKNNKLPNDIRAELKISAEKILDKIYYLKSKSNIHVNLYDIDNIFKRYKFPVKKYFFHYWIFWF